MKNLKLSVLLALASQCLLADKAHAVGRTWNGSSSTTANWNDAVNWVGGTAPATNSVDGLVFSGSTRQSNTNNFGTNAITSLTFASTGWALYGNPVTQSGPITNTIGTNVINNNLVLNATRTAYFSAGQLTINGVVSGGFGLATGGGSLAGTLVLSGANTYTGGTTINASSENIRITRTNALGTGSVSIPKTGTVASGYLLIDIPGTNNIITNTFAGFASTTAGATAVPDIENVSGTNTLTSALIVTGTGGNGLVVQSDAGGLLILNGNTGSTQASRQIQVMGSGNGIINGTMTNGLSGASFPLTKWGTGTWTLNGTNIFTGAVTINQGTIALGATGSISNATPVSLSSGTVFDVSAVAGGWVLNGGKSINGSGIITGSVVTAASGVPNLTPGSSTTQGTLSFSNNLTLNGTTAISFNLSSDPTGLVHPSDQIIVAGNLSAGGLTTVTLGTYLNGYIVNGTYPLIKFSGTLTGDSNNFVVTGFAAGGRGVQNGYIITNTGVISLVVTGAVPANLAWRGDGVANSWDITTTSNWWNGAAADEFYNNDLVTFDDTSTNFTVNLAATVTPGAVIFNATNNYTLAGADISGTVGLTKTNTGTLTLSVNNTYTGVTTYNGGAIAVATIGNGGGASPLGAAANTAANQYLNGGTLEYTGGGETSTRSFSIGPNGGTVSVDTAGVTLTCSGSGSWISSAGLGLTKTGPGILYYSFQQVLLGTNTIKGGIFRISSASVFGTDVTTPVVINGGALDIFAQSMGSKPVVASGMGDMAIDGNTNGAIVNSSATAQTQGLQFVTLAGDTAFGGTGRWDIRKNPTASLSTGGNAYNLFKVGANQVSLVGVTVDAMLANIDVRAGMLSYQLDTTGLGNPASTLTVENGATFDMYAATTPLNKQIVLYDNSTLSASSGTSTIIGPVNMPGNLGGGPTFSAPSGVVLNLNGVISGPGTVTKTGNGTLVLAATNTYTGTTTINGGALKINTAMTNTSAITTADGTTLGVIVAGTNQLSPSSLIMGGGSGAVTNEFAGLTSTTVAPLNPTVLNLNDPVTINIASGTFTAGQTYPLITFGSISGAGAYTLGSLPVGVSGILVTNGSTIGLSVSSVVFNDVWTAAVNTNWDISTTANWIVNGAVGTFASGNIVQFDDTSSNANVFVTTTVSPGNLTVNNILKNYAISGSPINGGGSLTKQGSGPLTLAGANGYTGGTTLAAGTLNINTGTAIGSGALTIGGGTIDNTSVGAVSLANNNIQNWNGDFTFTGSQGLNLGTGAVAISGSRQVTVSANTLTVGGVISDGGVGYNLTKSGAGAMVFGGVNSYSNTIINAGVLKATASGALPSTTTVAFGGVSTSATLDITGLSQTLAGMTFGTASNVTATVTILGDNTTSLATSPTNLTIAPINSAGKLTVNMATLNSFTYSNVAGTVSVNLNANSGSGGNSTVTLAGGSDSITATNLQVGNVGSGNSGASAPSTLTLGTNATLNANTISIGNSSSRASGSLIAGSGALTVRGTVGGSSPANLTIGHSDSFQVSDTTTSTFDASAGTLNALFGNILMGQDSSGSATARGVTIRANFNMGAGMMVASKLTLGNLTGSYAAGTYSLTSTLNLNSAGTATITNVVFADNSASSSPPTLTMSGLININGGATLNATNIAQGNIAGITTLNTKINWTNGIIGNISGGDLNVSGVSLVLGGSSTFNIDATSVGSSVSSVIGGPGAFNKSGLGTLTLNAAETYTGNTTVSAGTLAIGLSGAIPNTTNIVIAGGATFDVSAASPAFALASQVLSNSTATAILNGNADASLGTLSLTYASGTPSFSVTNGTLTLASTTTFSVNNTGAALGNGSFLLISTNTGGAVTVSDSLPPVTVTGGGMISGATAALNLTNAQLYLTVSGGVTVNTNSPVMTNSISGSTLTLSWPLDHQGWRLEVQTNTLNTGLGTNWFTWPNSTNLTTVPITLDPTAPTVFFRLVYP